MHCSLHLIRWWFLVQTALRCADDPRFEDWSLLLAHQSGSRCDQIHCGCGYSEETWLAMGSTLQFKWLRMIFSIYTLYIHDICAIYDMYIYTHNIQYIIYSTLHSIIHAYICICIYNIYDINKFMWVYVIYDTHIYI